MQKIDDKKATIIFALIIALASVPAKAVIAHEWMVALERVMFFLICFVITVDNLCSIYWIATKNKENIHRLRDLMHVNIFFSIVLLVTEFYFLTLPIILTQALVFNSKTK